VNSSARMIAAGHPLCVADLFDDQFAHLTARDDALAAFSNRWGDQRIFFRRCFSICFLRTWTCPRKGLP